MPGKYKNKYRNDSTRLQNWDYGWNAAYFVTICTKNRKYFFGEIDNGKMHYSPAGAIAFVLWHEIKNHAKNVELGEFVVMPDHVHGIVIINNDIVGTTFVLSPPSQSQPSQPDGKGILDPNRTTDALSLPSKTIGQSRFQNQGKNTLSSMIGGYKSAVTKYCNRLGLTMGWQVRFNDHIIRNDESLDRISKYIQNNPSNWKEDKLNN